MKKVGKKSTIKYVLTLSLTCLALLTGVFTVQTVVHASQLRTAQVTRSYNSLINPLPSGYAYNRGNWQGWLPRISHEFVGTSVRVTSRGTVVCTIQHCHAVQMHYLDY